MSTISRRAVLGASALVPLGLWGCTTGAGADNTSEPASPVSLRMVTWTANEAHLTLFKSIADEYIQANPAKVSEIKFETIPDPYLSGLTTQMAGGDVPDLAWVAEANAREFVTSGALADVGAALKKSDGYNLDDVLPNALTLWQDSDKTYAYPFSNSPFGLFANNDLLKQAGQPTPSELITSNGFTWDAVMTAASATAKATGKGGLEANFKPAGWDQFAPMWMAWGASAWTDDGKKATFDSPEMLAFYTWINRHTFDTGAIVKPGESFTFAGGDAAYRVAQLSASGALKFNFDFVPLPAGPKKSVVLIGQAGIVALAKGKNTLRANEFLAFFTNPTNSAKLAQFFPPPRKSLLTIETMKKAAPKLNPDQLQKTVLDQVPKAETKIGHPRLTQFADIVGRDLDAIHKQGADIAGALKKTTADVDPIISK